MPLRAVGWTDEALYFAITVCAMFNFYNRWIDATGVHALSDEAHRAGGKADEGGELCQGVNAARGSGLGVRNSGFGTRDSGSG